jgi:hypothetical protein
MTDGAALRRQQPLEAPSVRVTGHEEAEDLLAHLIVGRASAVMQLDRRTTDLETALQLSGLLDSSDTSSTREEIGKKNSEWQVSMNRSWRMNPLLDVTVNDDASQGMDQHHHGGAAAGVRLLLMIAQTSPAPIPHSHATLSFRLRPL